MLKKMSYSSFRITLQNLCKKYELKRNHEYLGISTLYTQFRKNVKINENVGCKKKTAVNMHFE